MTVINGWREEAGAKRYPPPPLAVHALGDEVLPKNSLMVLSKICSHVIIIMYKEPS